MQTGLIETAVEKRSRPDHCLTRQESCVVHFDSPRNTLGLIGASDFLLVLVDALSYIVVRIAVCNFPAVSCVCPVGRLQQVSVSVQQTDLGLLESLR